MSEELKKTKLRILSKGHGYETQVLLNELDISNHVQSLSLKGECGEYLTVNIKLSNLDLEIEPEILNGLIILSEDKEYLETLRKKLSKELI